MIFVFLMFTFKSTFSLSSFTFIKKLFSSLLSAIRVVSSPCLRFLIFLPAILIPPCASSSLALDIYIVVVQGQVGKEFLDNRQDEREIKFITVGDFIFLGSKITADGDCSHEIKRHLLLGRKVMTNLDSILKSRNITLPTKFYLVKAMVFPVVMYGCESWTVKKAEH